MFFKRKFIRILNTVETQLSSVQKNVEKDFDNSYQTITRKQAAKGMLLSGNTLFMIKDKTIEVYKDSLVRIIEFIKENYNGENNKIYTCCDVHKLNNLAEKHCSTIRKSLEDKFHRSLSTSALGEEKYSSEKEQIESELKEAFDSIDHEMLPKISLTLSYIKHKSWQTSWWFKSLIPILISVFIAGIVKLISKNYF